MEEHLRDKKDLEEKIADANKNLQDLKKRSMMNTITSQGGADKDKKDEENEVNIEELLKDITKDIHGIYRKASDQHVDLEAKQTIDILKVCTHSY